MEMASQARQVGRADFAIALLSPLAEAKNRNPHLHFLLALAHRDEQNLEEARRAAACAAELAPADPTYAFARAQFSFEGWRPSARLFRDAQRLAPDSLDITKNAAAALYAEGQSGTALKILERAVKARPDWIEGHQQIAKYRILGGAKENVDASFEEACTAQPENLALRLAWFHLAAQARDWTRAISVVDSGEAIFGDKRAFKIARAFIATETGDTDAAGAYLDGLRDVDDPGLDLCKVRFFLRTGDVQQAENTASQHIGKPSARSFWPYLSIAWRLMGDHRADWLDRSDIFVGSFDLPNEDGFLSDLAAALRALHKARSPYLEQSVRGGTQTDRNLFFHHEPAIRTIRDRVKAAVRDYVDALPPHESDHPLLSAPRGHICFEGSWSVRLGAQGFHTVHTHTAGWISSAFYVALPDAEQLGAPPSGWLSFGEPPGELGLDLPAYCTVEPKPGRLVLFPSTMWHGTKPFDDGERLTIAFDISRPKR
jgi:tetratricopeptide (TPR) repeat protein